MPRFLNIGSDVFHVPSLSNISMGSNCFGTHYISIYYHTSKKVTNIYYNSWEACIHDFNRLETSMKEIDSLLSKIHLTEPNNDSSIGQLKKDSLELSIKVKGAMEDLHKASEELAIIAPPELIPKCKETADSIGKLKEEISVQIEKDKTI